MSVSCSSPQLGIINANQQVKFVPTNSPLMGTNKISSFFFGCALICLFSISCKKEKENTSNDIDPLPSFNTCIGVEPSNGLTYNADQDYYRFTNSNGVSITLSCTNGVVSMSYENGITMTYELWGPESDSVYCNHESLNGKHIKDRLGKTRSLLYPDGTKVTLVIEESSILQMSWGDFHQVKGFAIQSGNSCHYINVLCNTVEYSGNNAYHAQQMDARFPDGETGTFETTSTGLTFFNVYHEEIHGQKIYNRVDLGTLVFDNPNLVNDWFDDPRWAHT